MNAANSDIVSVCVIVTNVRVCDNFELFACILNCLMYRVNHFHSHAVKDAHMNLFQHYHKQKIDIYIHCFCVCIIKLLIYSQKHYWVKCLQYVNIQLCTALSK